MQERAWCKRFGAGLDSIMKHCFFVLACLVVAVHGSVGGQAPEEVRGEVQGDVPEAG